MREALRVCSFNYTGQFQSLEKRNEQSGIALTLFILTLKSPTGAKEKHKPMKKIAFLIFAVIMVMMTAESAVAARKKVAVYAEGDITASQKKVINSAIMQRLSGNKDYCPFERSDSFLNALMKEQDYQLSGEVPESQIRKVGERFGVNYVIAIDAAIFDDKTCHMSGRLINLETGEVIKTANQQRRFEGTATITAMANNIAYRLLVNK